MADLLFSINVVLPLFFLMLLGFTLKRIGFFTDAFLAVASKFGFRILFSVLLFYNVYTTDWQNVSGGQFALFGAAGIILSAALLFVIVPLIVREDTRRSVIIQGIFRGNYLLFGLPLAINIYGEIPAASSMLVAISIPLFNIIAVIALTVFSPNRSAQGLSALTLLKGVATNPLIIGCAVGAIFAALSMHGLYLPSAIEIAIADISKIASPFALIILGGQFELHSLRNNLRTLVIVVASRLVLLPLVAISLAVSLGFRGEQLGALAILFAAPTAVSSQIMAYNMDADAELAGQIVAATTAFSSVSIFAMIYILKSAALI